MEIKLKRNLAIEFRLIQGIGDNFGVTAIVLQIQRLSYRAPETVITSVGFIRSCRQRMLYRLTVRLDTSKREMKNDLITLLFWDGNPLVWSESKRSQSWSRSRYFQAGVGAGIGGA